MSQSHEFVKSRIDCSNAEKYQFVNLPILFVSSAMVLVKFVKVLVFFVLKLLLDFKLFQKRDVKYFKKTLTKLQLLGL